MVLFDGMNRILMPSKKIIITFAKQILLHLQFNEVSLAKLFVRLVRTRHSGAYTPI